METLCEQEALRTMASPHTNGSSSSSKGVEATKWRLSSYSQEGKKVTPNASSSTSPATAALSSLVCFADATELDVDRATDEDNRSVAVSSPVQDIIITPASSTEEDIDSTNNIYESNHNKSECDTKKFPFTVSKGYYDRGSVELAIETPVMMERLEKRRRLTGACANDGGDCLLIVLVRFMLYINTKTNVESLILLLVWSFCTQSFSHHLSLCCFLCFAMILWNAGGTPCSW